MTVKESQVEEILATYPDIAAEVLGLSENLALISRQQLLPSGNRLDLLFAQGAKLVLVELKVVTYASEFLTQIVGYRQELQALQAQGQFVRGDIASYLLCPVISPHGKTNAVNEGIIPVEFDPQHVLNMFFARLKVLAPFIGLQPPDHGVWSLHLLNPILYALPEDGINTEHLSQRIGLKVKTIDSYLRLANEVDLVRRDSHGRFELSELGREYVRGRDFGKGLDFIADSQIVPLRDKIISDPFANRVTFGIYTVVESVFSLARNTYPVPENLLIGYFALSSGKHFTWSSPKAASHGTHMYTNYAIELGLVGRYSNKYYLTPDGIRFIFLLQLHKSIKMIDALGLSQPRNKVPA